MSKQQIGTVTHWFGKIMVLVVEIQKHKLSAGNTVRFKGQTTDFAQTIESMQLDGKDEEKAKKGQSVAVKVSDRVRRTDSVYKITDWGDNQSRECKHHSVKITWLDQNIYILI